MSSSTSAQDINTELGVSSTASVNLNATAVRNLACRSSGAISFKDCRWGINFPARTNFALDYATSNKVDLFESVITNGACDSETKIVIGSNGTLTYSSATNLSGDTTFMSRTWLTAGAAGDYTARFDITSGTLSSGSAADGTDLALSTSRTFRVTAVQAGGGSSVLNICEGNLIIKQSGTTLITRPVILGAEATDSDVGP